MVLLGHSSFVETILLRKSIHFLLTFFMNKLVEKNSGIVFAAYNF